MKPTRADVAKLANVSPALVSYVVNGGPRAVSPQARKRIEDAIELLDYHPNPIARALQSGSTKMIGLITPSPTNLYFAELAQLIEEEVSASSNLLVMGITNEDPSRELRYVKAFASRHLDGLLIVSSRAADLVEEASKELPIVTLDRTSRLSGASSVFIDNKNGAEIAVRHLQEHGIGTIACIGGPKGLLLSEERISGWKTQQETANLEATPALISRGTFTPLGGYRAFRNLVSTPEFKEKLSNSKGPIGLFISSDAQAIGVLRACHELKLRIPEDISFTSFDGAGNRFNQVPEFTSLRQPLKKLAKTSIEELFRLIAEPKQSPREILLEGSLRIGETCGC